jgi:hypothetical protein
MERFVFLILFCLLSIFSYSTKVFSPIDFKDEQIFITLSGTGVQISLATFVKLTPREYKKITGTKLSLKETLVFKIVQIKTRRELRKGHFMDLRLPQIATGKKPNVLVALLIVLGLTLLVLGILFLLFSGA